jgi:hypothetical protein
MDQGGILFLRFLRRQFKSCKKQHKQQNC